MASLAAASAFGDIIGSDVLNADGTVTYSYLVDNSNGSFDVAAWSLEFGFSMPDWNPLRTASGGGVTVPNAEWFAQSGTPVVGQSAQDFISLAPGSDVAVGDSLRGFSFTSSLLPGTVSFEEFSASGDVISGTTIGPSSKAPEGGGPLEAIAFAALVAFGAGVGGLRRVSTGSCATLNL